MTREATTVTFLLGLLGRLFFVALTARCRAVLLARRLGRRSVKQQYSWMMSSLFLAFFWLFDELYKTANSVLVMLLRFVLLPRYEAFFSFAALFSFLEFYVCSFRRILHFCLFSFVSLSSSFSHVDRDD